MKKNPTQILLLSLLLLICLLSTPVIAQENNDVINKTPELPGEIMLDFGFNLMKSAPSKMNPNWFRSRSFGLYFINPFDVSNRVSFRLGIGIKVDKFGETGNPYLLNYLPNPDIAGTYMLGFDSIAGEIKKNQFILTSLVIPVGFKFHLGKVNDKKGLFVTLGGSAAYNLESRTKIQYINPQGLEIKDKRQTDFKQPNLQIGAYGKVGFGGISLFYKYYFTNIFKDGSLAEAENTKYSTIGISITGL